MRASVGDPVRVWLCGALALALSGAAQGAAQAQVEPAGEPAAETDAGVEPAAEGPPPTESEPAAESPLPTESEPAAESAPAAELATPTERAAEPEPTVEPEAPGLEVEPPPPEPEGEDVQVRAELGEGLQVDAGDLFSLELRARIQFRIALGHASEGAIAAGADPGFLFEVLIRRARLQLRGHVLVPELEYYIQLGLAPLDMEPDLLIPLRDARLTWQFHRDIGVRLGQMKVPFGQQRVISSSALQFADRSLATLELNLDRDIGVTLLSDDLFGLGEVLQYQAGVFGGRGRNRFGALDAAMFVARVQVNPFGGFPLTEVDFTRTSSPRLGVGLAAAYNMQSQRRRSTHEQVFQVARFDQVHLAADLAFRWEGLTLLAEGLFREASAPSASGEVDGETVTEHSRSAAGWYAQLGYLLPVPFELAVRYGELHPLSGNAPEARFFLQRELGGAVSYYFVEHALKVQLDYFYYFGDEPAAERHQVRLQVQLYL